jgi:tetratricopeptide (TPR) repeat protein
VTRNPVVQKGLTAEGARWAFTTFHMANWHPLTWLSHMADAEIFGPDPAWHHRTNVLYHLLASEALLLVLLGMTGSLWGSLFTALLFAVHPLHVESVAWVSERKDLLCALFFFLTLGAWHRYVLRPGAGRYLACLLCLSLALLSKPMAVTLPFVLLLLDFWPLGRTPLAPPADGRPHGPAPCGRLLLEKVPFLLLALASAVVTVRVQSSAGAVHSLGEVAPLLRLLNGVASYGAYLAKAAWPSSLALFYPHPASVGGTVPPGRFLLGLVALAVGSVLSWRQGRERPWIAVGWLWYVGTLVPVIGIVQAGSQSMADRYTYLPLVGIFAAAAWTGEEAVRKGIVPRGAALAAAGGATILLAGASWVQAGYWKDSVTLYTRALAVTEGNWLAMNNLGVARLERGETGEALSWFRRSLSLWPSDPQAWNNLGAALDREGKTGEALDAYREAVRLAPGLETGWANLGAAARKAGALPESEAALREAVRLDPGDGNAWCNLGLTLARQERFAEAVEACRRGVAESPEDGAVAYNLALVHSRAGDLVRAEEWYRAAVRILPDFVEAWVNLAEVQARGRRYEDAAASVREAIRVQPGNAVAWRMLGDLDAAAGRAEESRRAFEEARRLEGAQTVPAGPFLR